jgi:hypothetical protein
VPYRRLPPPPTRKSERRDTRFAKATKSSAPLTQPTGLDEPKPWFEHSCRIGRSCSKDEENPAVRQGPQSRVLGGFRRAEIRANGKARYSICDDEAENRVRGRFDCGTLHQDRRVGGTEAYAAARRQCLTSQCLTRIVRGAPGTTARSARRSGEPQTGVLRHWHR